jgi:cobalamin-dependent methionine synthase I
MCCFKEANILKLTSLLVYDLLMTFLMKRDPIIKKSLKIYAEKYEETKARKEMEERRKFPLEQRLKQYIVGQEGAITTVASAIRR